MEWSAVGWGEAEWHSAPEHDARFANTRIANQQDLEEVVIVARAARRGHGGRGGFFHEFQCPL